MTWDKALSANTSACIGSVIQWLVTYLPLLMTMIIDCTPTATTAHKIHWNTFHKP